MQFKKLVKDCHQTAKDKGFWDNERNFGEMLMLIVSELGEAIESNRKDRKADLEGFKKSTTEDKEAGLHDEANFTEDFEYFIKDTVEDELADTFIRLFDLCGGLGIDIEEHIKIKMEYNKTREKLHGKKY